MTFVTGDCNLHLNVVTSEYDERLTRIIEPFVYEWTSKCRGSVSAEHGIGLIKTRYLKHNKSEHAVDLMRSLKNTMDPKCILNPYKVIPANAATDGQSDQSNSIYVWVNESKTRFKHLPRLRQRTLLYSYMWNLEYQLPMLGNGEIWIQGPLRTIIDYIKFVRTNREHYVNNAFMNILSSLIEKHRKLIFQCPLKTQYYNT